jgi:hypothetical protein
MIRRSTPVFAFVLLLAACASPTEPTPPTIQNAKTSPPIVTHADGVCDYQLPWLCK